MDRFDGTTLSKRCGLKMQISAFNEAPVHMQNAIIDSARSQDYEYGNVVISFGQKADTMFVVVSGRFTVHNSNGDREGDILPGMSFGSDCLLFESVYQVTVRAAVPGLMYVITRRQFQGAMQHGHRTRQLDLQTALANTSLISKLSLHQRVSEMLHSASDIVLYSEFKALAYVF